MASNIPTRMDCLLQSAALVHWFLKAFARPMGGSLVSPATIQAPLIDREAEALGNTTLRGVPEIGPIVEMDNLT